MTCILTDLTKEETWSDYLQYKIERKHLSKKELDELSKFIESKSYKSITDQLQNPNYCFAPPIKNVINKSGTNKKRIVYTYNDSEAIVLKVMNFLLYRYDYKINPNCYSFRKNSSAKDAIKAVLKIKNLDSLFCLKVDISNYFNSIPAKRLCEKLEYIMSDDKETYGFLKRLLLSNEAIEKGQLITENRGAMAGTPISPFFANIYLKNLDEYFEQKGILYFRYSDDIIMFFSSFKELKSEYETLKNMLFEEGLQINPDKVSIGAPNGPWEFLGIGYDNGIIDLSNVTINKLKAKIRRKAHTLYRWRKRRGATFEQTAKVMIRVFNRKFYDDTDQHSFTWSRWFFPLINTDLSLKELDAYLLQYIRYLNKGRHYKGNYKIKYDDIKALGYRSLVNEYYKSKSE